MNDPNNLAKYTLTPADIIAMEKISTLEKERDALKGKLERIQAEVDRQANDDGLWFNAETASEAYLQQEIRKLHAIIEDEIK
jgi:hypothetical protein